VTDKELNAKLRRDEAILWLKASLGAALEAGAIAYLVRSVWPPHSLVGFCVIFAAVWLLFTLENVTRLYERESEKFDEWVRGRVRRNRRNAAKPADP